ncbi:MAG: hypothetical protein LKJ25_00680 [Clostridia bacterium]|nr:hypothetical protein [Clostridia bacterium]
MREILFSIHTVELIQVMTFNEYFEILNNKKRKLEILSKYKKNCIAYFGIPGIRCVIHLRNSKPPTMRLIINLNAVSGGDENILFNFKFNDIYNLFAIIDSKFIEKGLKLRLKNFVIGRIDFTADIQLNSDEEVMEYIALGKKKGLDSNYKNKYNPGIEKIHYENSFDVECKNTQFTVYNKYRQMLDINYSKQKAECKYGILRVEVKLSKAVLINKIKKFTYCNEFGELNYIAYFIEKNENVIQWYIKKFYTPGTYYKYKTALKKVMALNIKEEQKEIACELIKEASICHSLKSAEKLLIALKTATKSKIKTVEKILAENNINPITIGERSRISKLPSLISLIGLEEKN